MKPCQESWKIFLEKEKGIDAGHQSPFESNIVILFVTVQVCAVSALVCISIIDRDIVGCAAVGRRCSCGRLCLDRGLCGI